MKKLVFLWFIAIKSYGQFGVITPDSSTLHGNIRFNSSILNLDSKLNGIALSFYINDLPSQQSGLYYNRKRVGGINVDYSNGVGMFGTNKRVWLSSSVVPGNNTIGRSYQLSLNTEGSLILSEQLTNDTVRFVNHGYSHLGENAPAIKMKKITGTTASTVGGSVDIALGVPSYKVLGIQILVEYGTSSFISANYTYGSGYEFAYFIYGGAAGYVYILNKSGNSSRILSKPFKILVTYEE